MPALPPVPGVIKVVVEGKTPVFPWANIFHVRFSGAMPTDTILGFMSADLYALWNAQFLPLAPVPTTLESVQMTDISSDVGAHNGLFASSPGTNPHDKLPGNVSVLVSKGISRRYRGGHPRSYFYLGGDGDLLDTAHWNVAFLNAVTAAYGHLQTYFTTETNGGCNLVSEVAVSYIDKATNPIPPYRRAVPLTFDIQEFLTQPEIASQRRRIGR